MTWLDSVRHVEALGYSTMFVPDHFDEGPGPITAMASAVSVTTDLVVGPLVLDCDFRHPAVVARELASIDEISEGRLEIGLGAGWKRLDYDRSGIAMDPPKVRVDRMIEHMTVLRGLLGPTPFTFEGEHYRITELDGTPKPYRPEGPRFLIGGGGKRVLSYAARHADIIGVNASIHSGAIDTAAAQDALPSSIDEKVGWVRAAAGDSLADKDINAWLSVAAVTDDRDSLAGALAGAFATTPDQVVDSPLVLIGNRTQIIEQLQRRRERWGYNYPVIPGDHVDAFAPIVAELTGT
jgi:probable F420-dependent oxidoreductase